MPGPARRRRTLAIGRGYYVIADDGSSSEPVPDRTPPDHFVYPGGAGTGGAMVRTGTMTGPVDVEVEVLDDDPGAVGVGEWDEVEEHELVALGEHVLVAESESRPVGFDVLEVEPGQRYRLRVAARGREDGRRYPVGPQTAVESHLVQLWPAL